MRRTLLVLLTATGLWGSGFAIGMAQTPALPAPGPDPQFVSNAIAALQQQRNRALDEAAQAQAQSAMLQNQLTAAQKELADLKVANAPKNATPVPEKK